MTLKEFQRLVKFAKKSGITEFKFCDVDVKFSPDAIQTAAKPHEGPDVAPDILDQYSSTDVLMWSAQGPENGSN